MNIKDKSRINTQNTVRDKIKNLPLSPGVYFFKDKNGQILYIGKANKLRQRVRSYFSKTADLSPAKQMMVRAIADIETIVTSSESEALILESIHIKKHKPRFNVALKDDKHFNFVKIDYNFEKPIITTVRRPELDSGRSKARYFGPYTPGTHIQEQLRFLRRVFPFRKKEAELTKFEQDLLLKRTLGPIPQTNQEYLEMIKKFVRVLEGYSEDVIKDLKIRMSQASEKKQYEKAAAIRDQIKALQILNSRQKMVSVKGESQDVVSIYIPPAPTASSGIREPEVASVNVFIIRAGKLIDRLRFLMQNETQEKTSEVLEAFLIQYYSQATNLPKELIIPVRTNLTVYNLNVLLASSSVCRNSQLTVPTKENNIKITVPNHGKKRELIKLGEENARSFLEQSLASWKKDNMSDILKNLQKRLKLGNIPERIEGYDISNIQGEMAVGSMVVFSNGRPDNKEYRKFKIKTIKGANDFAMLAEVLKRRFANTAWPKPDLILLDGGKGQLSVVLKSLFSTIAKQSRDRHGRSQSLLPRYDIKPGQFIALAKKQEEVFQGKKLAKINLDKFSRESFLLQRIRDEAHRFAQKYYHTRHSKADRQSVLDEVPGIGPKTKKMLAQKFGSISEIKQANKNDIIKLIGQAKTKKLMENI